jgi:3-dehydroquinate synthase class II
MTTIIIDGGLASGDEVLMYFEAAARHFGIKIEETIIEK